MFKYKELENYVTYITPLPSLQNIVVGISDNNPKSIKDLERGSITYLLVANFSNEIENNSTISLFRPKNFTKNIEILITGIVDTVIGSFETLLIAAKSLGKNKFYFGEPLIVSELLPWLQVSNKSKHKFNLIALEAKLKETINNKTLVRFKKLLTVTVRSLQGRR